MDVKRKRKSAVIGIFLVVLLLCVTASLAVLSSRMSGFSHVELHNVISLTRSDGDTNVTVITGTVGNASAEPSSAQSGNSSFIAYDDKTVWQSETNVEIFRLSYENGEGSIAVKSEDGADKLIAPGTSNKYDFTLENNGDVPLDYSLSIEAWVEGTDRQLPVRARVWDYTNKYLLGSEDQKEDVLELNTVNEDSVLGSGRYASYTLEWEWPFEQGIDEYDTMLGDLAVDGDLTLNIRIKTTAMYDEDPNVTDSGIRVPQTGDDMPVVPLTACLAAAAVIAAGSCLVKRKHNEE